MALRDPHRGMQLVADAAPALGELPHAVAHRDGESHGARGRIRTGHGVVEEGGQPPVAREAVDRRLEPVQQLAGAAVVLAQHAITSSGSTLSANATKPRSPHATTAISRRWLSRKDSSPARHEQLRDLRREEPAQLA